SNTWISNEAILAYIKQKRQLECDQKAFMWRIHLYASEEQKMAYAELLDVAKELIDDIESELSERQKEINQYIHFEKFDSLDQVCLKLHLSRPTLYRERKKMTKILIEKWKQHEWWFRTYMML
ncbi:MAG: hypothetical protein ACRC5Q_05085, partial [Culicoidibacterales bacterium]